MTPTPPDIVGVESCLWVGWGQLRAGGPGLWGHAKEGFLCMGKGILGGK